MPRSLKILLVAILVALVPLRSMAVTTAGIFPAGQQMEAAESAAQNEHGAPSLCDLCAGHCPSGALLDTGLAVFIPQSAASRILPFERSAPAFVPEQPDRPPLVLVR